MILNKYPSVKTELDTFLNYISGKEPKHYDLKVMQKIANGWVISTKPPKAKRSEVAAAALRHEQTSKRKQVGGNDEVEGDATEDEDEDVHPVPAKKKAKVAEDENVPRKEGRMEKSLPSGKKDTMKAKALEPTNTKAAKEKAAMEKAAKEKAARVKAKKERDAAVEAEAKAKIAADELIEAEKLKAGKLKAGKPRSAERWVATIFITIYCQLPEIPCVG